MGTGTSRQAADQCRIRLGHRVLEVTPGSPGAEGGLISFVDIIVAINGTTLDNNDHSLVKMVVKNVNNSTTFTVYNTKSRSLRDVVITPRKGWGGAGVLGLVARYDSFNLDFDDVLWVSDVLSDSPGADAGIRAHEDYILGSEKITFRDPEKLVDTMKKSLNTTVVLYVFNPPTDTIRPVAIVPSLDWPGASNRRQGAFWQLIGCGVIMTPESQLMHEHRSTLGTNADLSDLTLIGKTNSSRLESIGNLMHRTVSKASKPPTVDPSIPLPPPPPPPLPRPPTHEPSDEDEQGQVPPPPPGSYSGSESDSGSYSTGSSRSRSTSSSSSGEEDESGDEGPSELPFSRPPAPLKPKPVMTGAEMQHALESSTTLVRTKGLATHRMTRGAARRMSQAAAKRAALAAQGRLRADGTAVEAAPKEPVELMFKTTEQRKREEEAQSKKFVLSNPLLI